MANLIKCEECKAMVTEDGIGHRPDCSKCTDDGSEAVAMAWLRSRPPAVQAAVAKYPPTHLWKMKDTGHRVFIISFDENEDGTVTECKVGVRAHLNRGVVAIDRDVFGVLLKNLEDLGEHHGEDD